MGHIKEPEGVDFVINSRILTKEEEIAISDYIRAYKSKNLIIDIPKTRVIGTVVRKKVIA